MVELCETISERNRLRKRLPPIPARQTGKSSDLRTREANEWREIVLVGGVKRVDILLSHFDCGLKIGAAPGEAGSAQLRDQYPFWKAVRSERLVPDGALSEIWTSPPYNHCMFTARPDLDPSVAQRFAEALTRMSYDNPRHRAVLDAEGLREWVAPHLDGYGSLREASAQQGFFERQYGVRPRPAKAQR